MSEAAAVPGWTLGWRLQRSLDWAGVSAQEMADELDVSRGTISRWCNDHGTPPRSIYVRAWATRCKVPMVWLQYGDEGLPRVDSNHQPAGRGVEPPSTLQMRAAFRKTMRRSGHDRMRIAADS
ncbi:MAG: helix-turn-helix domain-containing protein [Micromonosporaceae bacterium]